MLLKEPLLSCPCCVFGVIVMLEDPATTHLQSSYWGKEAVDKILRYMAPSILPSIRCSRPDPFAEKQPQSMMFLPPCFTVGMAFLGLYSSLFFLQTRRVEFIPKSYILVSSDHMTFSHASPDHPYGLWQTSDSPGHVLAWAGGPCVCCRILIHCDRLLIVIDCWF